MLKQNLIVQKKYIFSAVLVFPFHLIVVSFTDVEEEKQWALWVLQFYEDSLKEFEIVVRN